jgi:chromate transporter
MLRGVQPVVIAIIAQALWRLGRTALKTRMLAAVGCASVVLSLVGMHELLVLFGAAAVMCVLHQIRTREPSRRRNDVVLRGLAPWFIGGNIAASVTGGAAVPAGLWPLFLFFLKVGSVLYGSGYVLIAFLRGDLVERWGWLTQSQLLDAVAVGQVTPGPFFTTATFIGYLLAGPWGAVVGTTGMFLPAFFFVAVSAPLLPHLRRSGWASSVLDGLNVGSLALMLAVTLLLARSTLVDFATWGLALGSLVLLVRFRLNATWLVAAGFLLGILFLR